MKTNDYPNLSVLRWFIVIGVITLISRELAVRLWKIDVFTGVTFSIFITLAIIGMGIVKIIRVKDWEDLE